MSDRRPKQVLIAQLNSIRSYRVRFYELLEERRPRTWEFRAVHDCDKERATRLFPMYIDPISFKFPILDVRTYFLSRKRSDRVWQTFFWEARKYDMVITDTYVGNLTYALVNIWRLFGVKRGYWGHTENFTAMPSEMTPVKRLAESIKPYLIRCADVFFAYTPSEKARLVATGFPEDRIVVLNNTIDTLQERRAYLQLKGQRQELKAKHRADGREVILYLGRLMDIKRLDLLFGGFQKLYEKRPSALLILAGGGPGLPQAKEFAERLGSQAVRVYGPVDEPTAQDLLTISDVFCLPGQIGLAPLRALCFDLPIVAVRVSYHAPEVEYLNENNALLLPVDASPRDLVEALERTLDQYKTPAQRDRLYPTIAHLTMENMVDNFIAGVNLGLGLTP